MHSIRFVLPVVRANTSVDSHRSSGAHAALYFVAMKYMFHTSSLMTPQNRLWLILSTFLLINATTNLALQVRWSWNVDRMLEGPDSAFNLARLTLSVCRSALVRSSGDNHLARRFMTMNWISDSILVSFLPFQHREPNLNGFSCSGSSPSLAASSP